MERKYNELIHPLDIKREEIVQGKRDPTQEELLKSEEYKIAIPTEVKPVINLEELKTSKGIPKFWLTALKNSPEISMNIKDYDEPILEHLTNIRHEQMDDNVFKRKRILIRTTDLYLPLRQTNILLMWNL